MIILKQAGDPRNHISTLLNDIGYALKCEWGVDVTLCINKMNTISKHFGYSTNMERFKYLVYSTNREVNEETGHSYPLYEGGSDIDYHNIVGAIENDINSSIPLLFSYQYDKDGTLTQTDDDIGHATVIDGYEHFDNASFSVSINLGWGYSKRDFYTFTRVPFISKANLLVDTERIRDYNITKITIINGITPCFGDENSNDCNSEYIQNGGEPKKPNFEIENGWNLKALATNRDVTSTYFDNAEVIYTYKNEDNKTWYKNPTYISPKEGFWIKSNQSTNYALIGENDNNTTFAKLKDIEIIDNCWYLLGSGKEMNTQLLNETFYSKDLNFTIFVYDNSKNEWSKNPDTILAGQGFWAKRNSEFINPLE